MSANLRITLLLLGLCCFVNLQAEEKASPPSAADYFQQGETALLEKKNGEAALNFWRAYALNPQSQAIRDALDRVSPGSKIITMAWTGRVTEWIHPQSLLIFGNALAWLGGFLLLIGLFGRKKKAASLVGALVFFTIGKMAAILGILAEPRSELADVAVVMKSAGIEVFKSPSDSSDQVTLLPVGSPVAIVAQRGKWAYCELPGGQKGWILEESLENIFPDHS